MSVGPNDIDPTDDEAGGVWLTKAQLAVVRRISVASADRLIRRQGWRRQPGNDGRVRVLVPSDWMHPRSDDPTDIERNPTDRNELEGSDPTDNTGMSPLAAGALAALEDAIAALREAKDSEIATLHGVIDGLRDNVARSVALLDLEHARSDRAEQERDTERARTDALRERLDVLQAELVLRDAEVNAAAARADRSEAAVAGESSRADALRERLDVLQAGLTAIEGRAVTAEEAAEGLRRADAERRARGLLARLRAAWQGK